MELDKDTFTMQSPARNSKSPKVSIGMPVYNGEKFIRRALDSLLDQTFADFEVIISDNASMDKTREICLEYAVKDERIRYYRNDVNIEPISNFNRVLHSASGQLILCGRPMMTDGNLHLLPVWCNLSMSIHRLS